MASFGGAAASDGDTKRGRMRYVLIDCDGLFGMM
jgi:hypothetical protein